MIVDQAFDGALAGPADTLAGVADRHRHSLVCRRVGGDAVVRL
jgi:hypothetical protein